MNNAHNWRDPSSQWLSSRSPIFFSLSRQTEFGCDMPAAATDANTKWKMSSSHVIEIEEIDGSVWWRRWWQTAHQRTNNNNESNRGKGRSQWAQKWADVAEKSKFISFSAMFRSVGICNFLIFADTDSLMAVCNRPTVESAQNTNTYSFPFNSVVMRHKSLVHFTCGIFAVRLLCRPARSVVDVVADRREPVDCGGINGRWNCWAKLSETTLRNDVTWMHGRRRRHRPFSG